MMRCFLPCFGASKRTKHLRSANATPTGVGQTHVAEGTLEPAIQLTQQNTFEEPIDCIAESKIKIKEQSNISAEVTSTKELIKSFEGRREQQEKAAREEETPQKGEKKDNHEEGDEVNKRMLQEESSESLFSLSIDSKKQVSAAEKAEIEVDSPMQHPSAVCSKKEESEAFGSSPSVAERVQHVSSVLKPHGNLAQGKPSKAAGVESSKKEARENTKELIVKPEEQPSCIAIRKANPNEESSAKELIKKLEENKEEKGKARPWNHPEYRYQDCCDEGYDDINVDVFEDDDPENKKRGEGEEGGEDVNNGTWAQRESSESLFSLSADTRKRISSAENEENEVDSLIMPARVTEEETQGSVLNPIENVTQGRVVKATVCTMSLKNDKENINLVVQQDVDIPISPEPNLKLLNRKARHNKFNDKKQEIGVDTSLSSWLVEPETTPSTTNSVREHTPKGGRGSPLSHEDRPILGALTIEEIRKYSVSTSSRRSRSRSPDETPIIGTVGSYWSHTGQSTDSDLNTSAKVLANRSSKWCSATLKTRLEGAFEAVV